LFAGDVACIAGAPGAIWCTDLLARPEVAAHELFHVFQVRWSQAVHPSEQALDPRWLIEGTATYVQARYGADVRGDSWPAVRQTFIDRANTSSTPLPDLTTWEGYAAGDFSASVSFAAADLLVTTHGEAALRHYFETLSFSSPDQAFNQAFNMSVADFYIEFEEARKSGFPGSA
jgi:hypothetical protein